MSASIVRASEAPETPVEAKTTQSFKDGMKNRYGKTKEAFGNGAASAKQAGINVGKSIKANPGKTALIAGTILTGAAATAYLLNDKKDNATLVVTPVVPAAVVPAAPSAKVEEKNMFQRGFDSVKSAGNTVYESAGKGCKFVRTEVVKGYESAKTGFTNVTTEYPYALPVTAGLVALAAVGYVAYQYFGTDEVQNS
jgi:hypothetical protein